MQGRINQKNMFAAHGLCGIRVSKLGRRWGRNQKDYSTSFLYIKTMKILLNSETLPTVD